MNRHRDNLTANCPHFKARTDYQSGHWITCAMGHKGFRSAWERNQYYKPSAVNVAEDVNYWT